MSLFTGCATALATPFDKRGHISCSSFQRLLDAQLEGGVSAVVVCGTTGESATLDDDEAGRLVGFAVSHVNGKIPVIAGAGSNDTRHACRLAQRAEAAGADALLVVTPYYNKTSHRGLISHYASIADATSLPIILYNVPSRTGMSIPLESYDELCEIPNVVGVKEASGNMSYALDAMQRCGGRVDFYSGNDDLTVPMMSAGAKGVISVVSNIAPSCTSELARLCLEGDFARASELSKKLYPLMKAMFIDVNPIPVKEALNMLGFEMGECRPPLAPLSEEKRTQLRKTLCSLSFS